MVVITGVIITMMPLIMWLVSFKTVINTLGHVYFLLPTPTQIFLLVGVRFQGKAPSAVSDNIFHHPDSFCPLPITSLEFVSYESKHMVAEMRRANSLARLDPTV